jgi:hypothetical protein
MSVRRVRRLVSVAAETVIPIGANATNSVPRRKILFVGAFAALLLVAALVVVVAFPITSRTDVPPNGTLKCYDSEGKYQPCLAPASLSSSRFIGRTTGELASWTTTALYQVALYQGDDHLLNWVDDHPANWTTSAPAAPRSTTSGKHSASARCGRRLLPCFFSAVARGLTHMASVAGTVGPARPARARL